jgi:hypothetical protein
MASSFGGTSRLRRVRSVVENAPADVEALLTHADAPPARVDAVERAVER